MAYSVPRTRTLISYSHDSEAHRVSIRHLAERLRQAGVDAWIDQFDEHHPPESWPEWMRREIEKSDFVVVVVTQNYVQRFNRQTGPGIGSGVRWEGALITADLYHSRRERAKFIPVVLRVEDVSLIPSPLNLTSWFVIGEKAEADITRLAQVLLRDPGELPAELGISASSPGVAFHFDGIHVGPEVDRAFAVAGQGDVHEAIGQLDAVLQNYFGDERAYILFLQGALHHKIGEVSQAQACFQRVVETSGHSTLLESAVQRLQSLFAEFQAHFGEGGPVDTVTKWLVNVKRGKRRDVWRALTREFRLCLAQDWIIANEEHPNLIPCDRDELAEALAAKNPIHPLGKHCLKSKLRVFQDHYRRWNIDGWGAAGNPRRIGLDYELIVIAPADEGILVTRNDESLPVYAILMRKIGFDWLVANLGPAYPIPGWPPTVEEIPTELMGFKRLAPSVEVSESDPRRGVV
ncbi:TIR domain-containing protein [Streptomyces murinus]|uniref:TIR domain-containing protein n=1 Tax=Streptomyces murinus TaxID=33900 RepID=UPI0036323965